MPVRSFLIRDLLFTSIDDELKKSTSSSLQSDHLLTVGDDDDHHHLCNQKILVESKNVIDYHQRGGDQHYHHHHNLLTRLLGSSTSSTSSEIPLPIYIRNNYHSLGQRECVDHPGGYSSRKVGCNRSNSPCWPPKRRIRTVFTVSQICCLEQRFQKQHYLTAGERIELARSLNLSVLQVKTWFQNRRMKWKKTFHPETVIDN